MFGKMSTYLCTHFRICEETVRKQENYWQLGKFPLLLAEIRLIAMIGCGMPQEPECIAVCSPKAPRCCIQDHPQGS